MIEGSGSVPLTNGSGSRRPKNIGTDPTDPDPQHCSHDSTKNMSFCLVDVAEKWGSAESSSGALPQLPERPGGEGEEQQHRHQFHVYTILRPVYVDAGLNPTSYIRVPVQHVKYSYCTRCSSPICTCFTIEIIQLKYLKQIGKITRIRVHYMSRSDSWTLRHFKIVLSSKSLNM
jgi:hypothetical protein